MSNQSFNGIVQAVLITNDDDEGNFMRNQIPVFENKRAKKSNWKVWFDAVVILIVNFAKHIPGFHKAETNPMKSLVALAKTGDIIFQKDEFSWHG